ncbi:DUF3108 domain-containing protein [Roseomonas sp. GC11]|uniref:DUF3108 domain-containing protein n=1 Tax=Roseomonas sp. GC11 TaxID=2950546 RepID=UPI002108EDA9|nr:DUF3108 domain-containing protein [Roseomonas sp. GC11]MCQ4159305.1 DUF3108 domain-containing protein [Roseomonas sp. GC11]
MMWRPASPLVAALGGLLLALAPPRAARAEPLRAVYAVQAAGMQVMRVEALFDLGTPGRYRIESRFRFTGLAGWFASGQQASAVEGVWSGDAARPLRYSGDGLWRGTPRQVVLEYPAGQPVARLLVPSPDPDREPVPAGLQQNTIDSLSALAQLTRNLATTGRCEGQAAVFDGRRRADFSARTEGRDRLAPWGQAWHGEAVRCGFQARQLAGFRLDDGPEAREPQQGIAWMAAPVPGGPILPVRVEMPGRWLGRLTGYLVEIKPAWSEASLPKN